MHEITPHHHKNSAAKASSLHPPCGNDSLEPTFLDSPFASRIRGLSALGRLTPATCSQLRTPWSRESGNFVHMLWGCALLDIVRWFAAFLKRRGLCFVRGVFEPQHRVKGLCPLNCSFPVHAATYST